MIDPIPVRDVLARDLPREPVPSRALLGSPARPRARPRLATRTLGFLLALPSLSVPLAHAAAPSPATSSPLRTTIAPTIDDAALLPQWLEERNPDLSQTLALPGHTQWIAIEIDGATYDYRITVTAFRDGAPLGPPAATLPCECNSEALLAMIDRQIDDAVAHLHATPLVVDAAPAPTQEPPAPTLAIAAPRRESPPTPRRHWVLSPLGIAGVATGAFGLIAIGAGTSLVVAPDRQIEGHSALYRELDPLGYTTLAIGVAALIGGVAMAAVDARRGDSAARATSRSRSPRRTFVTAGSARHGAGAFLWSRF